MHKPTMRTVSRWMVVSLVVLVGASIALHSVLQRQSGAQPRMTAGQVLDGRPAPNFALRDQDGLPLTLSQLRGRVVVVTFLDAACSSTCAVSTKCLDQTAQLLAGGASQVAWLAISVNPSNTSTDAEAFIAQHHITVPLHVLLGSAAQLQPVWQAYGVHVPESSSGRAVLLYVIDAQGHERELLGDSYDPQAAADDIRALTPA